MARIRSIHPDALKSQKLSDSSPEAERCYYRLLPHCDDEGRAEDDATLLAAYCFPLREDITGAVINVWLNELNERHLLVRYVVEGRRFLQVLKWKQYQKPQHPKASILPSPAEADDHPQQAVEDKPHEASGDDSLGVGEGVGVEAGEGREQASEWPPLWTDCARLLQEQVSEAVWQSTFANLTVTHEFYGLLLTAPSQWVKDRLETSYLSLVRSTLADLGNKETEIRIVIGKLAEVHPIDKRGTA